MESLKIKNDTEDEEIKSYYIRKFQVVINMIKLFLISGPIQFYLDYYLSNEEDFEEVEIDEGEINELFRITELADEMLNEGIIDEEEFLIDSIKHDLIQMLWDFELGGGLKEFKIFEYVKNIILGQMPFMLKIITEIKLTASLPKELGNTIEFDVYSSIKETFNSIYLNATLHSPKQEQD